MTGKNVYLPLTLDQEFQGGFACNGVKADVNNPATYFSTCPASELTSNLIDIPAPGKGDNDRDPPRIQPRDLFDASIGKDNIFHAERYKPTSTSRPSMSPARTRFITFSPPSAARTM